MKRLRSFLQLFNTLALVHGLSREEIKALLSIKRLGEISMNDITPELLNQLKDRRLVRERQQKIVLTPRALKLITPSN